jgi:NADH:ubiquinone oxidoreductase subunit 2 (subunit N)
MTTFLYITPLDSYFISWNQLFIFFWGAVSFFMLFRPLITFYILFNKNPNRVQTNLSAQYTKLFYKYWIIPTLLFTLIWNSPELTLLSNNITFSDNNLKLLTLSIVTFILVNEIGLNFFKKISGLSPLLNIFMANTLFFSTYILTLNSTLISFVFTLEFINLNVFGILLLFFLNNSNYSEGSNKSSINSIIIFFWINALTSVFLFILLTLSFLGEYSSEFCLESIILSFSTPHYSLSDFGFFFLAFDFTLINDALFNVTTLFGDPQFSFSLLFFFIFFFKLGLPPFIFWKLFLFDNASIPFIVYYNAPFFVSLLIYTLYLVSVLQFFDSQNIYFFFVLFLLISSLFVIFLINNTLSWGSFLAISSSITTALVYTMFTLLNEPSATNVITFSALYSVLTYVYVYMITLLLLLFIITLLGVYNARESISNTTKLSNVFKNEKTFLRIKLLLIFSSFAGLPPLTSFFAKLYLLHIFNQTLRLPLFLFLPFILIFLFSLLLFYFRSSRFLLLQNNFKLNTVNPSIRLYNFFIPNNLNLNSEYLFKHTRLLTVVSVSIFLISGFTFYNDILLLFYF